MAPRSSHPGLGFGFSIGHYTDQEARTGCTVVLPPAGNVASCDVRGSSPSSRELELLNPERRLTEIHGLLLTGGSAFGLAAADGVVRWLAERKIGYKAGAATVPIVPAAVIFDLRLGKTHATPGPGEGIAACEAATEDPVSTGLVGAGTGATVGKWAGLRHARPGGLGIAHAGLHAERVGALAVVNAVGDVVDAHGSVLAGTMAPDPIPEMPGQALPTNTVLALVVVEASLDKQQVRWLATRGSDGITVSIRPAHTRYDGDVCFAIAAPAGSRGPADLDALGRSATEAVASAIRAAVASPEV